MLMFTDLGRLHYLSLSPPIAVESVGAYLTYLRARPNPDGRVVCVDLRSSSVIAPDVADSFVQAMKASPAARIAQVLSTRVTQQMQATRLVREAHRDDVQRVFGNAQEAQEWLGELLTAAEKLHLRGLLDGTIQPGGEFHHV